MPLRELFLVFSWINNNKQVILVEALYHSSLSLSGVCANRVETTGDTPPTKTTIKLDVRFILFFILYLVHQGSNIAIQGFPPLYVEINTKVNNHHSWHLRHSTQNLRWWRIMTGVFELIALRSLYLCFTIYFRTHTINGIQLHPHWSSVSSKCD